MSLLITHQGTPRSLSLMISPVITYLNDSGGSISPHSSALGAFSATKACRLPEECWGHILEGMTRTFPWYDTQSNGSLHWRHDGQIHDGSGSSCWHEKIFGLLKRSAAISSLKKCVQCNLRQMAFLASQHRLRSSHQRLKSSQRYQHREEETSQGFFGSY